MWRISDVSPTMTAIMDFEPCPPAFNQPCYFGPALLGLKDSFRSTWNSDVMQQLRSDHDTVRGHKLCKTCYVFTDGGASLEFRKTQFLKGSAS